MLGAHRLLAGSGRAIMSRYAKDTEVSVEKSRAEIETILSRYGATKFAYMTESTRAMIAFEANSRRVRFDLPLPDRAAKQFTHRRTSRYSVSERPPADAYKAWEKACRQRWRALALVIKAKLEAVESGITEFEKEFYGHIVLPSGKTIYDATKEQVAVAYQSGTGQLLLTDEAHQ